ncbi:MAG: ArgR family transcriptional regulator [Spirochaetales bacterium]|nr:ArgR family transcriptional regulator [Spirochaetales bacterium]
MREREQRLKIIKKIIKGERIESQERLLRRLEREGYHVTQATLSRDLKLLKVGKQAIGSEGYFYSLPSEEIRREQERNFAQDFARGYVSLDFTASMAVIRTLNGHADSVAIAIDNLNLDAVLGTVAGNDTVLVALQEDIAREAFLEQLRERVPEFED